MNLKEKIGTRITESRKALGFTIRELASRTEHLSAARISNWEHGTRKPGPEEAKLLASVLNVSPSYLLGLSDNLEGDISNKTYSVPLLELKKISPTNFIKDTEQTVSIDRCNKFMESNALIATMIDDASMQPEFDIGDVIILNTELKPSPGNYVLAYLDLKKEAIFRRYSEVEELGFQLAALNPLWANITVTDPSKAIIIGVLTEYRSYF